jgi:hypothetical protein
MTTDYYDTDDNAPETLEHRAEDIYTNDQVFTPAGRWETVTGVDHLTGRVDVRTAVGRRECTWRFRSYTKVPVLRSWRTPERPVVRLSETSGGSFREVLAAVAANDRRTAAIDGHHLAYARWQGRGCGWAVYDLTTDATVTLGVSKAEAVAEVKRLARQHAKALGLPCELGTAVNR